METNHAETLEEVAPKIETLLQELGLEIDDITSHSHGEFWEFRYGGLIVTVAVAEVDG